MKPTRLLSCVLGVILAVQLTAAAQSARPLPRRANIILIVADGLGVGDLSCYGQTQFQTPNIDRLATSGIRFTRYSAGSISNSAARAALMLGKHDGDLDVVLGPNDTTIAQVLKKTGYFTSLIGEWDLGSQDSIGAPWLKGFDEFAGFFDHADAVNAYADSFWRYESNPFHNDLQTYNGPEEIYPNAGGQKGRYVPDWLVALCGDFVDKHQPDKTNHHRPFFLVLDTSFPGNGNLYVPTDAPYSEEGWPQGEKNRAALISRFDEDIGSLLQKLDKLGQTSNTVIFLTSDAMPRKTAQTDPKFFKENPSPDDLLVPLIVSWPGRIPAGQVSEVKCSACDLLPTVANLSYVQPPDKLDGVSLAPVLFDQATNRVARMTTP